MINRTTLNISLTPEMERFIADEVSSGRYQSASEVCRDGLRLLREKSELRDAALDEVRKKIAAGLEEARRGQLIDGEEVFRQIAEMSRKRPKSEKK